MGSNSHPNPLDQQEGALDHPETVRQYLADEIGQHQVAGPLTKSATINAHIIRSGEPSAQQVALNH